MSDLTLDDIPAWLRKLVKEPIPDSGCWVYNGTSIHRGYGRVSYMGKTWSLHRLAVKLLNPSEWNNWLQANHKCSTKLCFNPAHLYMGTQKQNMADLIASGKFYYRSKEDEAKRTHCRRGHELTGSNLYIHNNKRSCKFCRGLARKGRLTK